MARKKIEEKNQQYDNHENVNEISMKNIRKENHEEEN